MSSDTALAAFTLAHVIVSVIALFRRVPALNALAPGQSEPPFAVAQGLVLVFFVALGAAATIRFSAESLEPSRIGARRSSGR